MHILPEKWLALTRGEQFLIEWQYGMAGGFKTALAELLCRVDDGNLAKLMSSFPDEVQAYINYSRTEGYWEEVLIKAGIRKESSKHGEENNEVQDRQGE